MSEDFHDLKEVCIPEKSKQKRKVRFKKSKH